MSDKSLSLETNVAAQATDPNLSAGALNTQPDDGSILRNSRLGMRSPAGANDLVSYPCVGPAVDQGTGHVIENDHSVLVNVGSISVWLRKEYADFKNGLVEIPAWHARDMGLPVEGDPTPIAQSITEDTPKPKTALQDPVTASLLGPKNQLT